MKAISVVALVLTLTLAIGAGGVLAQDVDCGDLGCGEVLPEGIVVDDVGLDIPTALPDKTPLGYVPLAPCRLLDTRVSSTLGGKFSAGQTKDFYVNAVNLLTEQGGYNGDCGVPDNAYAIAVTITATAADAAGHFRAAAYGQTMQVASILNYVPGTNIANTTILPVNAAGTYDFSVYSMSPVHLVADVVGYFVRKGPTILTLEYNGITAQGYYCVVGPYTATGNQVATVLAEFSGNGSAPGIANTRPSYSTDGGVTWNIMAGVSGVASFPSGGGYVYVAKSHDLVLTDGVTYKFSVQAASGGVTITAGNCSITARIEDLP